MAKEVVLVLDFGSQYTHLIKSTLERLGVTSLIEPADITPDALLRENNDSIDIKGIILSGGAASVDQDKIPFDRSWFEQGLPILGICYGHQLIAHIFEGKVRKANAEYGEEKALLDVSHPLFADVGGESVVWMSHTDSVTKLPRGFSCIGSTASHKNIAIYSNSRAIYGLQFHPEVSHTTRGARILENFATSICGMSKGQAWSAPAFLQKVTAQYAPIIGNRRILLGLSGGVDSATLAATLRSFLPREQLLATYIDAGLEPRQFKTDVITFCRKFDIPLKILAASVPFFRALKGVTDPNEKRLVIGHTFIHEFEKVAAGQDMSLLAQGTIWSDVIESGVTKYSAAIKPHHNVGGLPADMKLELVEPFRELFKDQVRELAAFLGLPGNFVHRQAFPGPGFAIRIDGEVTRQKVAIVRRSTEIIDETLGRHRLKRKNLMAFAVYITVRSSGVKGDARTINDYAIVIRAVETANLMTASFDTNIFPHLGEIASNIIRETGTGKVLYDITSKPPSTIDWQ